MGPQDHGPNPGGEQPHGQPPESVAGGAAGEPGTPVSRPALMQALMHMDRYTVVDEVLQGIADDAPTPPPWLNAWRESTRGRGFWPEHDPGRTLDPRDRLAVWRAVRDSGVLPDDAGFFLVVDQIAVLTHMTGALAEIQRLDEATAAKMRGLRQRRTRTKADREKTRRRLRALAAEREKLKRRSDALTAELQETQWRYIAQRSEQVPVFTRPDYHDIAQRSEQVPVFTRPDYHDLAYFREQCPADWDQRYAAHLRKHGEEQIAQLYESDRERFEQRYQAGRAYLYPPMPLAPEPGRKGQPPWSEDLIEQVCRSGCVRQLQGGFVMTQAEFGQDDDQLEVWLSFAPVEVAGGPYEGQLAVRTFLLDIEGLRKVFDEVHACYWDPFGMKVSSPASSISVEGTYQGHEVAIRVLSHPEDLNVKHLGRAECYASGKPAPTAPGEVVTAAPAWVEHMVEQIRTTDCFGFDESGSTTPAMKLTRRPEYLEVSLSFDPAAQVDGCGDHKLAVCNFILEMERLRAVFDEVRASLWVPSRGGTHISYVAVSGTYRGHPVAFIVLSQPIDTPGGEPTTGE